MLQGGALGKSIPHTARPLQSLQCDSSNCRAARSALAQGPTPFSGIAARNCLMTPPTPRLRHFLGCSACNRAHASMTGLKSASMLSPAATNVARVYRGLQGGFPSRLTNNGLDREDCGGARC